MAGEGNSKRRMTALIVLMTQFFVLFEVSLGQDGSCGGGKLCQPGNCCSKFGYCGSTSAYCSGGNCMSQCPGSSTPPATPNPPSGSAPAGRIVTSDVYNKVFPARNAFYTYDSFISAAGSFPSFGTSAKEIAAFFAQVSHETSGLKAINENDQSNSLCDASNTQYPCARGQSYFGRGPLQISWNYNYGPAGRAIGKDLLNNPGLVAQDAVVSWKTALWFWTTPQSPKPSCHDVILGNWTPSSADVAAGRQPGFGVTIDIINGGIECGAGAANAAAAQDRANLFTSISAMLNVNPGNYISCANMKPF